MRSVKRVVSLIVLMVASLSIQSNAAKADEGTQINAASPPYTIEWNGTSGTYLRKATLTEPEQRFALSYLHTDAGPAGHSKYLVWFLARSEAAKEDFTLIWCYLDPSGKEFACWLYRFPSNQLISLQFKGNYTYSPPAENAKPSPVEKFNVHSLPHYVGPNFTYQDWTRQIGSLGQLPLYSPKPYGAAASASTDAGPKPVKTLTSLRIAPLHEVDVGAGNGWKEGGWQELHTLAYDSAEDPYYLILYSNTKSGYAIDLKNGQIYVTDFGSPVHFSNSPPSFGPQDNPLNTRPDIRVRRYDRHEITLTTTQKYANPYTDVQLGAEFHSPDDKIILVPGYWDGGTNWRVRFAPTSTGVWSWKIRSAGVPDLNGKEGRFECVSEDQSVSGYLNVQPLYQKPRHFSYTNGTPFLPALLRYAAMGEVTLPDRAPRAGGIKLSSASSAKPDETQSIAMFQSFQQRVDACATLGLNRFVGGYLLGKPGATTNALVNEGGLPFIGENLNNINPAFFQAMDKRIAYCNARGIVPDIGLAILNDNLFMQYPPEQLFRLWGYVLARYSSFNVFWNIFQNDQRDMPATTRRYLADFDKLTQLYDPNRHPLSITVAGPLATAAAIIPQPILPTTKDKKAPPPPQLTLDSAMLNLVANEQAITLLGGEINSLFLFKDIKKPLILMERPSTAGLSPDIARRRMWETRMQGNYWVGDIALGDAGTDALGTDEIHAAAACARLFRMTHFYRLEQHNELLGGPEESPADRKRRKKAEQEIEKKKPKPTVIIPDDNGFDTPDDFGGFDTSPVLQIKPVASSPIYVLADPAREYVLYFEQGGTVLLDLLEATGRINVLWFNPKTGASQQDIEIRGGVYASFTTPDSNDWVLFLSRK